jgi:hypothetical protein
MGCAIENQEKEKRKNGGLARVNEPKLIGPVREK